MEKGEPIVLIISALVAIVILLIVWYELIQRATMAKKQVELNQIQVELLIKLVEHSTGEEVEIYNVLKDARNRNKKIELIHSKE